jgi:hypothetical protein
MVELIENEGYAKKIDLVNYLGDIPGEFPVCMNGSLTGSPEAGNSKSSNSQARSN